MHSVRVDGCNSVCLYAKKSHHMDRETKLYPVCGYQHNHLQRLLLHQGEDHHRLTLCALQYDKTQLKSNCTFLPGHVLYIQRQFLDEL